LAAEMESERFRHEEERIALADKLALTKRLKLVEEAERIRF
jgi:hypothetical protein